LSTSFCATLLLQNRRSFAAGVKSYSFAACGESNDAPTKKKKRDLLFLFCAHRIFLFFPAFF
jgi:hypothetical protein